MRILHSAAFMTDLTLPATIWPGEQGRMSIVMNAFAIRLRRRLRLKIIGMDFAKVINAPFAAVHVAIEIGDRRYRSRAGSGSSA